MRWRQIVELAPVALPLAVPWVLVVSWPAMGAIRELGTPAPPASAFIDGALVVKTLLWHLLLGLAAVGVGAVVARRLHSATMQRENERRALLMVTIATALLAPWILFAAWWTVLAPGNAVHDWLVSRGHGVALRRMTLFVGVVGWAWAPAAIVLWWWCATDRSAEPVLEALDGVRPLARLRRAIRRAIGGALLAFVVVLLALSSDVVCFDLAQERSVGFEMRGLEAQGASTAQILRAGAATSILTLGLMALAGWIVASRLRQESRAAGMPMARRPVPAGIRRWPGVAASGLAWCAGAVLVILPLALLALRMIVERRPWDFIAVHGPGAANALLAASGAGVVAGGIALLHSLLALQQRRPIARAIEGLLLIGWALAALLPSSVVAGAMASAWSGPGLGGRIGDSPLGVVLGAVGRLSLVAALAGAAAGRRWSRGHAELERLDEAQAPWPRRVGAAWHARSPMLIATASIGGIAVAALAAGEIAVTSRLEPPGHDWIASSVLAAIHYQRPGAAMAAIMAMALAAFVAAIALVTLARGILRCTAGARAVALLCTVTIVPAPLCGCSRKQEACAPLEGAIVIGGPGVVEGRFDRPRGLVVDRARSEVIVVDKTARVQRFARDGTFLGGFQLADRQLGQPVGLSIDDDGSLLIPDTHYHRVLVTSADGELRREFGSYGFAPGEFVYPTDVVVLPDGSFVVGEYGGVDRVQVIGRDGRALRTIGEGLGPLPGSLERPQSLALSRDGRELFVVDACNHRIQVFDMQSGALRRVLGGLGTEPGRFFYPWAVVLLPDDSLLVAEQGNSRLQRLDPQDGRSLGLYGGRGREAGRLDRPWAIDIDDSHLYIADTANSRVQVVPLSSILGPRSAAAERGAIEHGLRRSHALGAEAPASR